MHLVDDIDFIPSLCRPVGYLLTDFTDVVDTVVRCRVDLDDVRGNARQNRLTRRTFVARLPSTGCSQLTERARILAIVVFPVPRVPQNRYA